MPEIVNPDSLPGGDPVAIARAEASWRATISLHVQNLLSKQADGFKALSNKIDEIESKVEDQRDSIQLSIKEENEELRKEINKLKLKNAYQAGAVAIVTSGITLFVLNLLISS